MGIYVHVPFCRSKCFYCGFYSMASLAMKTVYLDALRKEIIVRKDYLKKQEVDSLYFGGGTPSVLDVCELQEVVERLESVYVFSAGAERTIEMNPEDLTEGKLRGIKEAGFNRISVGVQSFSDERLREMNRRHTGAEATEGIRRAAGLGFDNISMDLIIGLPGQTAAEVREGVETACILPVQHISVYILSVDPGTVYEFRTKRGEFHAADEDTVCEHFRLVCEVLKANDFEHYEISNFARDGKYSRHNISYWQQKPYIGFGPSAHSYDLRSRQWNVSRLNVYAETLEQGRVAAEREVLTEQDLYNEYVMTNLRTMWGVDPDVLQGCHGTCFARVRSVWERYLQEGKLVRNGERIRMSEKGWLISDAIFSDLFVV